MMSSLSLLVRLSFRNLRRHRRRNLLMLLAIVMAVSMIVFATSLIRAMQWDMAEAAVKNLNGHLKVTAPGYLDDPGIDKSFSLDREFDPADFGIQPGDSVNITGWASRVRVPAVIMSEPGTRGIQLVGVDPVEEDISFLSSVRYTGSPLSSATDKRIVIGQKLAEQLETKVGRRLVIISQGLDGKNREAGFRIGGIYDAEGTGLEKVFVFTGRDRLQALLDAPVITEFSLRLSAQPEDWALQATVAALFADLDVRNWLELEPTAAAMFGMADLGIFIYFLIMMGALTFGLVNTLITAVMERMRELGLLQALGMRPGQIVLQVVIESSMLMLLGVVLGVMLGVGFVLLLGEGIDLSQWAEGVEAFGVGTLMVPRLHWGDIQFIAGLSLLLGVLASLYPARRAVKIRPLDALGR